MICEIARIIHPDKEGHRQMGVITFKFDESYNKRTLVVGGWMAEERQWHKLKRQWRRAIVDVNRELPRGQKISRYHAAEMNANDGDYKGWENRTELKIRFTKNLFRIVGTDFMTAVAVGIDLKSFIELFPHDPPNNGTPYVICMSLLMVLIGEAMAKHAPNERLALIHDHGDWDVHALNAYNRLIDDPKFEHRHRFVSITPLSWRDDTGLQSADMIAYEAMRLIDNQLWTGKDLRRAMQELLKHNHNVYAAWNNREALQKVKGVIDGRKSGLEIATVQQEKKDA